LLQLMTAMAVMKIALRLNPVGTSETCLPAESGAQVLLHALDITLQDVSSTWLGAAGQFADPRVCASIQSEVVVPMQGLAGHLMHCMARNPGAKDRVAGALLEKDRLLLWFGCLEKMHKGEVAEHVVNLLVTGMTASSASPTGTVVSVGDVTIPASRAAEVGDS
jgi:hypothetical protein